MRGLESAINGRCGRRRGFEALLVGCAGVGAGGFGLWVRGVARGELDADKRGGRGIYCSNLN